MVVFLAQCAVGWFLFSRIDHQRRLKTGAAWQRALAMVIAPLLLLVGVRGGVQDYPIDRSWSYHSVHPVLNLASARLITGRSDSPRSVADKKLTSYPRGPLLGIPGAPSALPGPAAGARVWTVCDQVESSSGGGTARRYCSTVTFSSGVSAPV